MEVTSLAVCGDSFGVGSGMPLDRCYEDSFGGQVANELGLPLKVFARSGCCNFSIYLQVKKIVQMYAVKQINPLVLVTLTHHSRLTFPIDSTKLTNDIDLKSVDYKSYMPYSDNTDPQRPIEFEIDENPNYVSETLSNLNLCLNGHNGMERMPMFSSIMERKWKAISMYFEEVYDDAIKKEYDSAIALMMHCMLKEHNIPHVIMGFGRYNHRHIADVNWLEVEWGMISKDYPDEGKSGHCNQIGHRIVAKSLIPKCQSQLLSRV